MESAGINLPNYVDQISVTENDSGWFVIENFNGECKVDVGPAEMIKNLKVLGQPYRIKEDVVIEGQPMQVRLLISDGFESGQIVYYRGEYRCKAQVELQKQPNDAELNRYK